MATTHKPFNFDPIRNCKQTAENLNNLYSQTHFGFYNIGSKVHWCIVSEL